MGTVYVFLSTDLLNPFYIMVYRGMVKKAQQYDMRVVLCGKFDFDNIEHFSNGIVFSNEFIAQYYLKNYGKRNDIFMMYLYTGSSFKTLSGFALCNSGHVRGFK